jgi:hypothetical protein
MSALRHESPCLSAVFPALINLVPCLNACIRALRFRISFLSVAKPPGALSKALPSHRPPLAKLCQAACRVFFFHRTWMGTGAGTQHCPRPLTPPCTVKTLVVHISVRPTAGHRNGSCIPSPPRPSPDGTQERFLYPAAPPDGIQERFLCPGFRGRVASDLKRVFY